MTRVISKYVNLFMDEVAGAIYLHDDHYKMSKIQQFFTVLWVHRASSTYFTYTTSI